MYLVVATLILLSLVAGGCRQKGLPEDPGGLREQKAPHTVTGANQDEQRPSVSLGDSEGKASLPGKWEKPQTVLLSTTGVLHHFIIGEGGMAWDPDHDTISLGLVQPGDSPSFWLVSPFFEPKKFNPLVTGSAEKNTTDPVDLSSLAADIPFRPVPVAEVPWGYQAGHFPHYGSFQEHSYSWVSETGLALHPGRYTVGLVDLLQGESTLLGEPNRYSMAVSADNTRIAYTRNGYLVVQEIASGKQKRWALTKDPATDTEVSVEMLSWSPNGRYLLGAWYPTQHQFVVDKLWALDWENGNLVGLLDEKDHPFGKPTWSPDGNQVVLYESFVGYTEGYDVQWILVDLPTASTQVVVPRSPERIDYRFTWDSSAQLQAGAVMPGPGGTRVVGYDPNERTYQDTLDGDQPFTATQLRFLKIGKKEAFRVDLMPTLKDAGLPLDKVKWLYIWPQWSPDGNYLYLEGYANGENMNRDQLPYTLHGSLDLTTRTARFLPAEEERGERWFLATSPEARWAGSKIILSGSREGRKLRVLDVKEMETTTVAEGEEFLAARYTGKGLLYVSTDKIVLLQHDGTMRVLLTVPEGETFVPPVIGSPFGHYLAIPRERQDIEGLRWITLEILNLTGT